ncbi:hypothetical protein [Streptomyces sp. AK02-01A]|uniref:hypothetical protein n=1 Tax=Streptomyces sp. AK02-01A TaxID=3028648 RepID=UPI0029AA91DF|nr:hypothetical protein [Streptomyces sp. AK02-01A]MDX3852128.1 hypothetical protein [Streptomyces sp. AK02-01A]
MAWICPRCQHPEAVAHVENADGFHPFPCLNCGASTLNGPGQGTRVAGAACCAPRCGGAVTDTFVYDHFGRLSDVRRGACSFCGSTRTAQVRNARSAREHRLPRPRM